MISSMVLFSLSVKLYFRDKSVKYSTSRSSSLTGNVYFNLLEPYLNLVANNSIFNALRASSFVSTSSDIISVKWLV